MLDNEQIKQKNCFIERQIENAIKYIKSHKLLMTITISINLCIMIFLFIIWYLYGHSLPELSNTDKLSAVFNFFIAVGTIALAIFGWMAYKYAIDYFIEQQNAKTLWLKKYQLIKNILTDATSFILTSEGVCRSFSSLFKMHPEIKMLSDDEIDMLNFIFPLYRKDLSKITDQISGIRDKFYKQTHDFSELNLLGVTKLELESIAGVIQKLIQGSNEYQQIITNVSIIFDRIEQAIKDKNNELYMQEIKSFNLLNTSPFNIELIDNAYNEFVIIGRKLLNIK